MMGLGYEGLGYEGLNHGAAVRHHEPILGLVNLEELQRQLLAHRVLRETCHQHTRFRD
jgi:hypothetical protein